MSDFKAKMLQIRFRLGQWGSVPDGAKPRWGAYSASPAPSQEPHTTHALDSSGLDPAVLTHFSIPILACLLNNIVTLIIQGYSYCT